MEPNKNRESQKNQEANYNPTNRNFDHEHVSGKNTPINEVSGDENTKEKKSKPQDSGKEKPSDSQDKPA